MDQLQFRRDVIEEFQRRSGILVDLNKATFVAAMQTAGGTHDCNGVGGAYYNGTSPLLDLPETLWYLPDNSCPSALTSESYLTATLFHEIGHATKIKGRLNRWYPIMAHDCEEVVAELASKKLAAYFGILTDRSEALHNAYINNYLIGLETYSDMLNTQALEAADFILDKWLPDLVQKQLNIKEAV